MNLNDQERQLLREIQRDCTLSQVALAERCGMAPSTVWRKLQEFENSRLIAGRVALLDPVLAGRKLCVLAHITLADHSEAAIEGFTRLVERHADIQECFKVSGTSDYMLKIRVADVEAYGKFPVVGLAKRLEEVFFPGDTDSVFIAKDSASLQLLQRARNEAHRFAVTFQRKQRKKNTLHTELEEIEGIGPATSRKLLRAFGSLKRVREASEADLAREVGPYAARLVREHFDRSGA